MMENLSSIKYSIVLVPFPFEDHSGLKVRPALCLTSEIGEFNHVVIAFISSKIPDDPVNSDFIIKKGSAEWVGTGLTVDSVVRLHKIVTIPKSLIKRRLGRITEPHTIEINTRLHKLFEE